ncbi:MAG: hypothetical protein JXA69_12250 [Phycisphaerae bacterium]|nr:hypothetical protein [Phycisphaerae bacterium]
MTLIVEVRRMRGVSRSIAAAASTYATTFLCGRALLSITFLVCSTLAAAKAEPVDVCPPDAIAQVAIDAYYEAEAIRNLGAYVESTDAGVLAWSESYLLKAFVAMYEATGDMDQFVRVRNQGQTIMAHRGDRLGMIDEPRGYILPAWIATPRHELGPHAWIVHQGMITYPLARWTYLVHRDPSLRMHSTIRLRHRRRRNLTDSRQPAPGSDR